MKEPLYRRSFDAATLLKRHPPQFQHPHKKTLYELAYPDETALPNQITVTRWAEAAMDSICLDRPLEVDVRPDFYDYKPVGSGSVEWHVNFADPRLFVAYGSSLFAQDEMQVAEHPLLGSIREALLAADLNAMTIDGSRGAPILIRNVERKLEISTNPDARSGRPDGLYGNRFATASFDVIRRATRRIDPPTISNFIAIAAPAYGRGEYTKQQIESIFMTAFTGFSAAQQESVSPEDSHTKTVIHSGFWGCGAFGGNRKLMIALQAIAAKAAKIDQLIFHAGNNDGVRDVRNGIDVAEMLEFRCGSTCSLDTLVARAADLGYRWGVGDGN